MSKVLQIAAREFTTVVFTRAFIIGILVLPALIGFGSFVMPKVLVDRGLKIEGQIALVDPTGLVVRELREVLESGARSNPLDAVLRQARNVSPGTAGIAAALAAPKFTVLERPAATDIDAEKLWLGTVDNEQPHFAVVVVHGDAVVAGDGGKELGSYDLYVPPKQDGRVENAVQQALRDAIVGARLRTQGMDRTTVDELITVARVQSVTVSGGEERGTNRQFAFFLPIAFMVLLMISVMGSGQGLLTSTIEEKSSRVIEVLLSAVSPLQLMAGKLLGHMAVSFVGLSLYIGMGLLLLASFSLFGLLDLSLIGYLLIFYVLGFFTIGSLMMAAGAAVNDIREAQALTLPINLIMMTQWFVWVPISRDPNSTFAIVASFIPPINCFSMLLRLASSSPPPAWQVWLSIGSGCVAVVGAIWFAAKVFRIGLLMFGKPPNLATLIRWVRAA